MIFNQFEQIVIDKILDYDSMNFSILKKQIENSSIVSRESSTAWFFTNIEVNKNIAVPIKSITKNFIFWDVGLKRDNEDYMWFLLFIEEWYITMLEWYTYDQEFKDFTIFANYSFEYDKVNVRDIPEKLK